MTLYFSPRGAGRRRVMPDLLAAFAPLQAALPERYTPPTLGSILVGAQVFAVTGSGTTSNLQAQLDAATSVAGPAVVLLEPGVTYVGNFQIRNKVASNGWTAIVTRPIYEGTFPRPAGQRIQPSDAAACANLEMPLGNSATGLTLSPGLNQKRFWVAGLNIRPPIDATSGIVTGLLRIGVNLTSLADRPGEIVVERCRIHGYYANNVRRASSGIFCMADRVYVGENSIDSIYQDGTEGKAVVALNTTRMVVRNNTLSAGSIHMLVGGDPNLVAQPADIIVERNLCTRPDAWRLAFQTKNGDPEVDCKNFFEVKQGQRVLVQHNIFERSWNEAQTGRGISIKSTASASLGGAPVAHMRTSDITVRQNLLLDSEEMLVIQEFDAANSGNGVTLPVQRLEMYENFVRLAPWKVSNRVLFFGLSGVVPDDMLAAGGHRIARNTIIRGGGIDRISDAGAEGFYETNPAPYGLGFDMSDNVVDEAGAGWRGPYRSNAPALAALGITYGRNLCVAGANNTNASFAAEGFVQQANLTPTHFLASRADFQFVNEAAGNYRIGNPAYQTTSTRGTPPGANLDALDAATAGCRTGVWP